MQLQPQGSLNSPASAHADILYDVKIARKLGFFFGFFFAVCIPATPSEAATRLEGVVLDKPGGVISGAIVKLFSLEKIRETQTDGGGRFEFADLLPASYDLQVEHPGFKTGTLESIQVTDKAVRQVSITLQIVNPTCDFNTAVSF